MKIKFSHIDYYVEGKEVICRVAIDKKSLSDLVNCAAISFEPDGVSKSQKLIEEANVFLNTFYEGRARLKSGDLCDERTAKKIAFKKAERHIYKRARILLLKIYSHNAKIMNRLAVCANITFNNKIKNCTQSVQKISQFQNNENKNISEFLKPFYFGMLNSGLWFRIFEFNDRRVMIYENGQWDEIGDYLSDGTQDDYDGEEIILIFNYASDFNDARDEIRKSLKTGVLNDDKFLWTKYPNEYYEKFFDKENFSSLKF